MIRTLIVDDDEPLRTLLRWTLRETRGFHVVGDAFDGIDAIEKATRLKPDLILLDLVMPGMSGLEALPRIRMLSPESVVVVLSMLQRGEAEEEALRLGAAAFLDKGMSSDELVEALQRLVFGSATEPPLMDRGHSAGQPHGSDAVPSAHG